MSNYMDERIEDTLKLLSEAIDKITDAPPAPTASERWHNFEHGRLLLRAMQAITHLQTVAKLKEQA